MACSLQKLFAVGEEFEDEDFLLAVEDAESRCAGPWPVRTACLRPGLPRAPDGVSGQLPACPPAPSEASGLPALGLRLPAISLQRSQASAGTAALRLQSPPCAQEKGTLSKGGAPPLAPRPGLAFESQQPGLGDFEGPEQDEFDKVLADMELDGPGLEPTPGLCREAPGILPKEDMLVAQQARSADRSQSFLRGPRPAAHTTGSVPAHHEPPAPRVPWETPQPPWRPSAVGAPNASVAPAQRARLEAWPPEPPFRAPRLPQTAGGALRSSLRGHLPSQPCPSPTAGPGSRPGCPRLRAPGTAASSPSMPGPRASARVPFPLGAPRPCGDSPVRTPKGPQAALQTPIVTNRLVQLVSAANRTPQQPPCPGPHAKARRFPGPAGVLPHQHSGKNLEEIMVSTPQTPAHGALAKLRTKVVSSSQTSVEEDFGRGPWLTMKSALGLDERDPACFLCAYSIVMVLRKAALRQLPRNKVPSMAVMIKSLTRSTVDASAVFRDPTGEMQGTVHRLLLESRHSELKPGSVLLLKQVGVFSPSLRNHYLNVTPSNLVRVYCCDTSDGGLGTEPSDSQDSLLQDETGKPEEGLAPARAPEPGAAPEEELPEADDLDGLLSELPEDFFCGTSTGQPP